MYYNSWYKRQFKDTKLLRLSKVNGVTLKPSLKLYFSEYPYKIKMVGNNVHHNIEEHVKFSKWLNNITWDYREQWTPQNFNLFLKDIDVLYKACKKFPHLIDEVHGPISKDHLEQILDNRITVEYREKLWHNKYSVKYVFAGNKGSNEENRKAKADLTAFINSNYKECKWYSNSKQGNWYVNYLFVTQKESDELLPFLKMSYNDLIDKVVKCEVITQDVLEKKENE